MNISGDYRRRIHIMGKPNVTAGYMVKVYDAETSEEIENILKIDVTLRPSLVTTATITYVDYGPNGELLHDAEGKCIEHNVVVENPSLNLTAYELDHRREQTP